MKLGKNLTALTFLLFLVVSISAQMQPKISWKNVQETYQSFYDIKPVIVNESNKPIYFDCSLEYFESQKYNSYVEKSDNTKLLLLYPESNRWISKEERGRLKEQNKEIKRLQKEGTFVPRGCKINPSEEYSLNFSNDQWNSLIKGDGSSDSYKTGKFKFEIKYWWYNNQKENGEDISESPNFAVIDR
jgi:hypothetical protein